MTIYECLKGALLARQAVAIVANGSRREICSHIIGTKHERAGGVRQNVLAYQFGGDSSSGLGPNGSSMNWRCIHVDEIVETSIMQGERWHTVDQVPAKRPTCIDEVDADVWG